MTYHAASPIQCVACQTWGAECQCLRLDNDSGEYLDSTKSCSGSGCMEALLDEQEFTSSGPVVRHTLVTQSAPLPLINASRGFSFLDFRDDNSYHFFPQQEIIPQPLTPPDNRHDHHSSGGYHDTPLMSPGRADCLESLLSLAWPGDELTRLPRMPDNPGSELTLSTPELESDLEEDLENSEDPEDVQAALIYTLSLDRTVESNNIPFILQASAIWMSHFLFEPLRITYLARDYVFCSYASGAEVRWRMNLLSNNAYNIIQSTDHHSGNAPIIFQIQASIIRVLTETSSSFETSRELDRQYALGAMSHTYECISSLTKVASLSSVLSMMQITAPVFRRACPDPLHGLINLPSLLATVILPLQYYSTIDVLLGVLTGRPMFFRYDVNFTPEAPESLFHLEDGPGLRWLYGVPDRLFLTLAKMNGLIEDFGPRVRKEIVDELEAEIQCLQPIVWDLGEPALIVGRVVVQECWILAALIYLYMGLCGADSTDPRVTKVRAQFMKVLTAIKSGRNPDAFLVFPMVILGIATDKPSEQNTIRQRILGVSECSRAGTMGHDFVRMLDSIWATRRPNVWADLRQACWEVSGM